MSGLFILLVAIILLLIWGIYEQLTNAKEQLVTKTVVQGKINSVSESTKPKMVLYNQEPIPCAKPKVRHRAKPKHKVPPVKAVIAAAPAVAPQPVAQQPATPQMIETAQPSLIKEGMGCGYGDRKGTYQIINGQMSCLLDGVTRVTESYHRNEPEVVYVQPRQVRYEELPPQEDAYYEEDQSSGLSSWLPWTVAAGALWWGSHRTNPPPPPPPGSRPPSVVTGPVGPGVTTGPAW